MGPVNYGDTIPVAVIKPVGDSRAGDVYSGDIVIPETVTYQGFTCKVIAIANQAFSNRSYELEWVKGLASFAAPYNTSSTGNSSLTSVTIPNSVITIGKEAFANCTGLTAITIPNSVTEIGDGVFEGCIGLSSVNIGNGVKTIGENAFYKCSSLTSISLGSGVETIDSWAFEDCIALKDFYCFAENIPIIGSDIFSGVNLRSATLHVPAASLEAYSAKSPWKIFGQIVPIDEGDGIEQVRGNTNSTNQTVYDLNGRHTTKMQ
ncbi:MAG: leucine-rich repeat domain-containing protein, partial [Bacteroidaceae bacterium]|nr:leucine-rich repeat domain-containing protein [Bacteroidaceae bacterium]